MAGQSHSMSKENRDAILFLYRFKNIRIKKKLFLDRYFHKKFKAKNIKIINTSQSKQSNMKVWDMEEKKRSVLRQA